MTKNKKQKKIPDGWQVEKYNKIFNTETKSNGLKKRDYLQEGKIPIFDQSQEYIAGYSNDEEIVNDNFPIILFGDHTRIIKYINQRYIVGNDGIKLLKSKNGIDDKFLYYLLLNKKISNTGYNRHFKYLKDSYIFPKSIDEQKKIAEILGVVDEDIERTEEVIEKTERLKKGLMQELFTRGIGHTKFKKTKLGKICEFKYGFSLPEKNRKEGNVPVYGSKGKIGLHNIGKVKGPVIIVGRKGTIGAVTWSNVDCWPIDTTYYIDYYIEKGNYDLKWLYYLLLILRLNKMNTASGTPGLNRNEVYLRKVLVPPIKEQQKIAEILSAVDEKISVNKELKEKLIRLKKGLMQDLLSGEVRVNV